MWIVKENHLRQNVHNIPYPHLTPFAVQDVDAYVLKGVVSSYVSSVVSEIVKVRRAELAQLGRLRQPVIEKLLPGYLGSL